MRHLAALAAVCALAGCGEADGEKKTTTGQGGAVTVEREEVQTGLEIKDQTDPGFGTTLTVTPTRYLPAGVRTRLEGRKLTATCAVPDVDVATLAHVWPDLDEPFESRLQTKDGDVSIAERATGCSLTLDGKVFA